MAIYKLYQDKLGLSDDEIENMIRFNVDSICVYLSDAFLYRDMVGVSDVDFKEFCYNKVLTDYIDWPETRILHELEKVKKYCKPKIKRDSKRLRIK